MTRVLGCFRRARSLPARGRRHAVAAVTAAILLVSAITAVTGKPHDPPLFTPFAVESPFRTPVSDGATVDPNSSAIIASVSRDGLYANLVEYGIPIYHATAGTPVYNVQCTITEWTPCPFAGYSVPIPDGARPHTGSDRAMVVVDDSTKKSFEFWQARHNGNQWTASWGAVNDLDGSGWGGASTGSGASRLAGVIQIAEIQQGDIPHALAIQSNNVCANIARPPAHKTDGKSTRSDCIPEGARIRLDPAVDLDSLTLAPAVRTLARAVQTYGAYVVDHGDAPLSVSFELDPNAGGDNPIVPAYQAAGLRWDYDNLPGVPWDRLQVLA
jgi:hypothetical protein